MSKLHRKANINDTLGKQGSMSILSKVSTVCLTELPIEVLEIILSHLPAATQAKLNGNCDTGLLTSSGRSITQVNGFLRRTVIQYIHRNVLWVHLVCNTSMMNPRIHWLFKGRELEPDPFWEVLPDSNLPGLHLEFVDTWVKGSEYATTIRPFDFRWIASMVGSLLGARYDTKPLQRLNIRHDHLPSRYLEQLVIERVHSLVPVICRDVDVSVFDTSSNQSFFSSRDTGKVGNNHRSYMACAFPRADILIGVLADLDRHGLKAEGTLLCMYYYFRHAFLDRPLWSYAEGFDPESSSLGMGRLKTWAGVDGALSQPDWDTNPDNLERVRRMRTLHYLNIRACCGYIQGVRKNGWQFIVSNPLWVNRLDRNTSGEMSWFGDLCYQFNDTFGLLDYEIAQLYHVLSVFYKFRADISQSGTNPLLFTHDRKFHHGDLRLAFSRAFYAWSCDINNPLYMEWLTDLCVLMPVSLIDSECDRLKQMMDETDSGFGGDPAMFHDWKTRGGIEGMVNLVRAHHLARKAEVSFDKRRGDKLPRDYDALWDWQRQKWFLTVRELDLPSVTGVSSRAVGKSRAS